MACGSLDDEDLTVALADPAAGVREHAVALAEPRLARSDVLRRRVVALAGDPAVRVRFQVAFTLGEVVDSDPKAVGALAALARRDADDPWVRTAVLSSAVLVAGPLFDAIAEDQGFSGAGVRALLHDLAGFVGASGDRQAAGLLLDRLAMGPIARSRTDLLDEVLLGLGEGLARAGGKTIREVPTNSAVTGAMLESVLRRAEATAADGRADPAGRERAIALMGQAGFATARRVLGPLAGTR